MLIQPYPISEAEDVAAQAAVEHRESGAEAWRHVPSGRGGRAREGGMRRPLVSGGLANEGQEKRVERI